MGKSRQNNGASGGLVVVLIVISLVVAFWQWILFGIVLYVFFRLLSVYMSKDADPYGKPKKQRRPRPQLVRSRPLAKDVLEMPVRPKPTPARELSAPDYLPRWTTTRRFHSHREHDDWQKRFDSVA